MLFHQLSLNTNMLDLGAMLGTQGKVDLIRQINENAGGGSFFGGATDPFRERFQAFTNSIIIPIRQASQMVADTVRDIINPDHYRSITSIAELKKGIPPCMWYGIVYQNDVRDLLTKGVIDGFGIDPNTLADKDPYENLCQSGNSGWISYKDLNEKGEYIVNFMYDSTDPELTPNEALCLSDTRDYIKEFLTDQNTQFIDPTDYPNLRG